ncbi:MAG: erythromycin esterase family protein [Caulobacterales bacterium]|nr:erythromycin esterase family protein [Caulobacterales bacterium]
MPDIRPNVEPGGIFPRGPASLIAAAAEPLPDLDDPAFGRLFDRFGDARVVLLGEASHGTAEFYRARAAITRHLVEHRGFNIVALEADWPDAQALDARVRRRKPPAGKAFSRFPTWMWRNREVEAFLAWLEAHNAAQAEARPQRQQAGVYGLDLYNLAGSMRTVIDYLDRVDPEAAGVARQRYGCLTPWVQEPQGYGRMALSGRYAACEGAVTAMLKDMLERQLRERGAGDEALLDAAQSARLVRDAEAYYRAMYWGGAEAWNLRDTHMFETLQALLDAKGPDAKAVVWAHNSHIGDARATEMGLVRDELNLGQLARQAWGEAARLIGFGTHTGTVACASDWDAPMEVKTVRPSMAGSQEAAAHDARVPRFLLDMRPGVNSALRRALVEPRLQRFIGVIYRPETERWSHYVEARLSEQFDAFVWFDETTAVTPLARGGGEAAGEDDTWPFGV